MAIGVDAVLAGLLANALTTLIGKLGRAVAEDLRIDRPDGALAPLLKEAIDERSEEFEWDGPGRLEEVCLFLASPDAESIVRQVYASSLAGPGLTANIDSIESEFVESLAIYVDAKNEQMAEPAGALFRGLVAGCKRMLAGAIDKGYLSAHDAMSAYRHRVMMDELAVIQKRMELATRPRQCTLKEIIDFEGLYREQVADPHSYIIPPHLDSAKRVPIAKLHVPPTFTVLPTSEEESPEDVPMYAFMERAHRCVVLGNPGGGKSTFASRLCHDLVTRYEERLLCHRRLTPAHVVMREYGAARKERDCSLLDFIERDCNAKYQVKPPPGAFEYLLLNGRVLVILDGLDELLDTSYRKEMAAAVEAFCNLYPETPVVVTSRHVGYEEAPLDPKRFQTARLAPFSEDQSRQYVENWFNSADGLTPDEKSSLTESFLKESRIVPDLCSNPLMLGLLCTIYRGEKYIPRNRPDVYEKCALMLFERWDKSRGIKVLLPFEAHIQPAMMHLAHWIYADPERESGVTEDQLTTTAADYLTGKAYEDRVEAEHAAREFIRFCKGRAWVFSDTEATATESLYQFTHRTFLEYFAARYLVRANATPSELGDVLFPRIAKSEWDVVAQLAFQIQNKNIEGAGDKLLIELLHQSRERREGSSNLLRFAARSLAFLVPSPSVVREITDVGVRRWIVDAITSESETSVEWGQDFLRDLFKCAHENGRTALNSLEAVFVDLIRTGSEDEAWRAAEAAMSGVVTSGQDCDAAVQREWSDRFIRVADQCSDRLAQLSKKHFGIAMLSHTLGHTSVETLVNSHGPDAIFEPYSYSMFPDTIRTSLAEQGLHRFLCGSYNDPAEGRETHTNILADMWTSLTSRSPPWFQGKTVSRFLGLDGDLAGWRRQQGREGREVDRSVIAGAFVLLAAEVERGEIERIKRLADSDLPNATMLGQLLNARFEEVSDQEVEARLSALNLEGEHRELLAAWVRNQVQFTDQKSE